MLHVFNRTNVYTTYAKENLDKVTYRLDLENVEYLVRMTNTNRVFDELGSAYQLYVHREDTELAQRLIHEALFPTENTSSDS